MALSRESSNSNSTSNSTSSFSLFLLPALKQPRPDCSRSRSTGRNSNRTQPSLWILRYYGTVAQAQQPFQGLAPRRPPRRLGHFDSMPCKAPSTFYFPSMNGTAGLCRSTSNPNQPGSSLSVNHQVGGAAKTVGLLDRSRPSLPIWTLTPSPSNPRIQAVRGLS